MPFEKGASLVKSSEKPKRPKLVEFGSARKLSLSNLEKEQKEKEQEEQISKEKLLERRSHILNELFRTEATYVEYLQVAINLFLRPIQASQPGTKAYMPPDKVEAVFQNIEQLQDINAGLLKKMALRKTQSKCAFGPDECWLDLLTEAFSQPELREGYQKYMHGYNHAISTFVKLTKRGGKNTSFGNWLQSHLTKNNDLCRGLGNLPAFLICPVQRLPRYLLILRDLQKCTPEDHPDYINLQKSFKLIQEIVGAIDKEKTRYDEIYHLQSLYERFSVQDRQHVPELMDPSTILVTEGPILFLDPISNSFKLRHLILTSYMVICAKKKKETFQFAWKVDLYNCRIQYEPHGDGADDSPFICITEQKKEIGDVLTTETSRTFYTFSEEGCEFDFEFWQNKLSNTQNSLLDVSHISSCANNIVNYLQPQLLTKRDWDLLSVGATVENLRKGQKMIDIDASLNHLYHIQSGQCVVEDGEQVISVLTDGDFYGECTYLGVDSTESSAVVIVESEKLSVTKISYDRLTSILSGNNDLSRRFFHLVTLVASRSYLRRASRALGSDQEENFEEIEKKELKVEEKSVLPVTPTRPRKIHPALVKLKLDEIAPDEEVLQEYSCKLKKTKFSGNFYVMKEYIGFYSHVLGKKTRIVVPGKSVTEVVARDDYCIYINNLKHNVGPFELQFKTQEKKQEAYTILASFLSDKKRSLAAKTGLNFTASGTRRGSTFLSVTDKQWEDLISNATETNSLKAGDVVLAQGFIDDRFYQVLEGSLHAKVVDPTTQESAIIDVLKPGSVFGEIPFLLGLASNVSYEAACDSVIVSVRRTTVEQDIQEKADFGASVYKLLAKTLFMSLFKLKFCDQPDVIVEQLCITAPIIDPKKLRLTNSPLPDKSQTVVLRRDFKRINATSHNSLPTPGVQQSLGVMDDSSGLASLNPSPRGRSPSFTNVDELNDSARMEKSDSWISVNKRASPTIPRRQLMSRRSKTDSN